MKTYISILFLLLFSLSASGIPRMESTRIQVLSLPSKNLPLSDGMNIAIIANINADTRSDSLVKANYPTDSSLVVKAALALKQNLEESPVFSNYTFPVYNYKQKEGEAQGAYIPQLANDIDADYLFTLDIINTKIWYDIAYNKESYASSNVLYSFVFKFYDIRENQILDTYYMVDTLVIETTSDKTKDPISLFKNLIIGNAAVIKACEQAGKDYAGLVTPQWVDEIRYYFNDDSREMTMAGMYVENQQWADATELWLNNTTSSNQRRAAMACYNMALACEMSDNFNLAIEWLEMAKKKDPAMITSKYEKILRDRISNNIY